MGNFKHFTELSPEEIREMGRKGGIASGKARQERKLLREELAAILADGDVQKRMCTTIVQKALDGDGYSFQLIRDTLGEKVTDKLEIRTEFANFREHHRDQIRRLFLDEMYREEPLYGDLARSMLTYEEQRDLMQQMIECSDCEEA